MSLTIVIVQSRVTQHWGYCPAHAVSLLRPELQDKPTGYLRSDDALAAARADKTIPRGAKFEVR